MKDDKPYSENFDDRKKVRRFSSTLDSEELVWHRDRLDRVVKVLAGKDWQFQIEDELPIYLKENDVLFVPKETYHRIIKGDDDLVVEIKETK